MRLLRIALATATAVVATMTMALPTEAAVTPPWDPFFASPTTIADFGVNTRPFGVAAGDYDGDGKLDVVVGRTTGNVAFVKGNGNGTFAAPTTFAWKQAFFNAWAFAPADVNGDGNLDVVWGANAASSGCSISPVPVTGCPLTITVNDGDVRAFLGNGNGTFQETTYFVSGVRHNAGLLLADIGSDAGSVTAGDVDGDGDADVVAGAVDGANSTVKLLENNGAGIFAAPIALISQPTSCITPSGSDLGTCSPIYFPAISTQNSPWGLSIADADGDGDRDLWVTDRALYTYLYRNDGSGAFALQGGNTAVTDRPNVYRGHDSFRAAVGFTASTAAGDVNGDGKADVALGIHSGTNTPTTGCTSGSPPVASPCPHDGKVLLDVSSGTGHAGFGSLADIGTQARGVALGDVNGDGYLDVISGTYEGQVKMLRQLPPLDTDEDGVSDYLDNSPEHANAARLDMNIDGLINHLDQLDNDFDTVLGNPEDQSTWQRLGDPADGDDDNDGVADGSDNCPFTANPGQQDADQAAGADTFGNACDPLDNLDPDGDGIPTGPVPGDPLHDEALAARAKWSQGDTHFVIRIDALSRIFQNEFTQIMTDAATLSPADWEAKCWENYGPVGTAVGPADPADPCGTDEGGPSQTVTLEGGKEVPVTLVTISRLLWTDEPVVAWINDRNGNPRFELGQHGTYHASNTAKGDWAGDPNKNFFSCELCGLTEAESVELLRVGHDTLLGNYQNGWVAQSGASEGSSEEIDWSNSANPLLSYAAPFNADDPTGRKAIAQLGFMAHSSSVFEENNSFFTPEGSHHEQHDQWGLFHASADLELEPPDTTGDTYDTAAYEAYLQSNVDEGGLTTWLIEEVEWSGRPCPNDPRVTDDFQDAPANCTPDPNDTNRENNTVYQPRWDGWMQLLEFVRDYPGGVAMTMGEVALAMSFDNAPTVANPDQADSDNDGIGDVIDGATLVADDALLSRNSAGTLSATLTNGAAEAISGQEVEFSFDSDGDATAETYTDTTDASGLAEVTVTPTRPVGPATFDAAWDGVRATAADSGDVTVADSTDLRLDASNPSSGQVTDQVTVGATLEDSDGQPLPGQTIEFSIGSATGSGTTDASGHATATLTLQGPAGAQTLQASFAGAGLHGPSSDSAAFTVSKEDTALALADAKATKNTRAIATATLTQDGQALAGKTVEFFVQEKKAKIFVWTSIGTATTDDTGVASKEVPANYVSKAKRPIRATFAGDADFLTSTGNAFVYRV